MILAYNILWWVMILKKERDIEIIYKDGEVDFDYINTMISFIINLISDVEKEERIEKISNYVEAKNIGIYYILWLFH